MQIQLAQKIGDTLELIKFSHSIFALPFALGAMWTAAGGWPGWKIFLLIVAAMVTARSTAMAFNRLVDFDIDKVNPRTKNRPLTSGKLSRPYVVGFIVLMTALFISTCHALNHLALQLSPFALLLICGYSYTKRFTFWAHIVLGIALGISPIAAQVAVNATITLPFIVLGFAIACWVSGFDILYSLQDINFDKKQGLHSIPARFGIANSLWISRLLHLVAASGMVGFGALLQLNTRYFVCVGLIALTLVIEQSIISPTNLTRINTAFFTANGWISMLFLVGALLG